MRVKYISICLITLIIGVNGFCQSENLVINPSFEDYEKCPEGYTPQDRTHKLIQGWGYPTIATPDYFHKCAVKLVGVPKNFAGESEPKTGKAYVGLILSGTDDGYREYIQGRLVKPMVEGQKYCVTYSYKLASYSKFAVDQLSLYFSEIEIKNDLKVNLGYKPQINNQEGLFLDNINEWETKCIVYKATGDEKFLILGNFKSYENTNYVATDKNIKNLMDKSYAYYYIDDVAVRPLDNCTDCPCVRHDFEAEIIDSGYTGGMDPFTEKITGKQNDGYIKIAMAGGTPPYTVEWSNGLKGSQLKNLYAGEYVYVASDAFNCKSAGKIVFVQPVEEKDEFESGFQAIEEGASIVLEDIFFEFNSKELKSESFPELDKVVSFISDNNISKIEISGHTDNEGSDTYNQRLSEGRARSVVAYIVGKGIPADRLNAVGYGESKPIDTNISEEGREKNRRVEFTLLKK